MANWQPRFHLSIQPLRGGVWTHDGLFEEDTFAGNVHFLLTPVDEGLVGCSIPFTFSVMLTQPRVLGYVWVGAPPTSPTDSEVYVEPIVAKYDAASPRRVTLCDDFDSGSTAKDMDEDDKEEEDPSECDSGATL